MIQDLPWLTLNWPYLYKVFNIWSRKGPDQDSRDALTNINIEHEWYLFSWFHQEVGEGNFEAVLQLLKDETIEWGVNHKLCAKPKKLLSAITFDFLGEEKLARGDYITAVKILERKVREIPDDPRYHSALGIAYAGIGQKTDAIEEGKRAVELLPMSVDAVYGVQHVIDLATIYTMVGEPDLAMDELDYLLTNPSWISASWLEWDIHFAPLKSHPRYQALISKYGASQ